MPKVTNFGEQPGLDVALGPSVQAQVPAAVHGLASTVGASSQITSNLITSDGYQALSVGVTSTQAGVVSVQRYLDDAGTIAQGAAISSSFTAANPCVLNSTDGLPFASFTIKVSNTGGSTATLSNLIVLMQANQNANSSGRGGFTATIAASGTTSTEIPLNGFLPCGVYIDASMTGTSFTFKASAISGGPYSLISDGQGSSYTKTFRAGDFLPLDPATFSGVAFLQLVSGSTEGSTRNLTIIGVPA